MPFTGDRAVISIPPYRVIAMKHMELGGDGGFLGEALHDVYACPDGIGLWQQFKHGVIYWSPKSGAHEVHGPILQLWTELGREASCLGYPISDERNTNAGGAREREFQHGTICWSNTTGAVMNNGFRMQYQLRNQWCWIAVGASVLGYYDPSQRYSQCALMTGIGQRVNGFPANTTACPSAGALSAFPLVKSALAHPYSASSFAAFDAVPDVQLGTYPDYNKTGSAGTVLENTPYHGRWQEGPLAYDLIRQETEAGRPIIVYIDRTTVDHYVMIVGARNGALFICDPTRGNTVVPYSDFPSRDYGVPMTSTWLTRPHDGEQWSWFQLGGGSFEPGTPLATVCRNSNHLEVFGVGLTGNVYGSWWDGQWHPWYQVGSGVFAQHTPLTVARRHEGHMEIFGVGLDGHVYGNWWNGLWRDWFRLGRAIFPQRTQLTVVCRDADHMEIFGVGGDGHVYANWWDGQWHDWFRVGGGIFAQHTPLAVARRHSNHMEVFGVGLDGHVYGNWWDGQWHNWYRLGGGTFAQRTPLSVVSRNAQHMELVGVGQDGRAYATWWDGQWHDWFALGSGSFSQTTPLVLISRNPDRMDVFGVGQDGRVYNKRWSGQWDGWKRIGPNLFGQLGPLSVVSRNPDHLDLFGVGLDGMVHSAWRHGE